MACDLTFGTGGETPERARFLGGGLVTLEAAGDSAAGSVIAGDVQRSWRWPAAHSR